MCVVSVCFAAVCRRSGAAAWRQIADTVLLPLSLSRSLAPSLSLSLTHTRARALSLSLVVVAAFPRAIPPVRLTVTGPVCRGVPQEFVVAVLRLADIVGVALETLLMTWHPRATRRVPAQQCGCAGSRMGQYGRLNTARAPGAGGAIAVSGFRERGQLWEGIAAPREDRAHGACSRRCGRAVAREWLRGTRRDPAMQLK